MPTSTYYKNKIAEHAAGKTAYTMPTLYVALSTTDPATGVTEPNGNGYTRKLVAPEDLGNASNGVITNTNILQIGTATGNWGTITHTPIYDHPTSGNLLSWSSLQYPKTITYGDPVQINPGQLTIAFADP